MLEHNGAGEGPASDEELLARASHDPLAFAALYDRYVAVIYRYCHHRLGDQAAAEDATSAIFTRAFAALPISTAGNVRSWLFSIAHNTVVDCYRRHRPTQPLRDAAGQIDLAPTPDELALTAADSDALFRLIAHLPPDQQRVLTLRLSGLTSPEVATIIGRSPGAVRSLQFRAVTHLRDLLGQQSMEELHGQR